MTDQAIVASHAQVIADVVACTAMGATHARANARGSARPPSPSVRRLRSNTRTPSSQRAVGPTQVAHPFARERSPRGAVQLRAHPHLASVQVRGPGPTRRGSRTRQRSTSGNTFDDRRRTARQRDAVSGGACFGCKPGYEALAVELADLVRGRLSLGALAWWHKLVSTTLAPTRRR
jgi:hypothetical protein